MEFHSYLKVSYGFPMATIAETTPLPITKFINCFFSHLSDTVVFLKSRFEISFSRVLTIRIHIMANQFLHSVIDDRSSGEGILSTLLRATVVPSE